MHARVVPMRLRRRDRTFHVSSDLDKRARRADEATTEPHGDNVAAPRERPQFSSHSRVRLSHSFVPPQCSFKMATYSVLCLNCQAFGSNIEETRNAEHKAIIDAFNMAKAENHEPSLIALQDYEWNSEGCLTQLISQINEAHGAETWKACRQWGNAELDLPDDKRDAIVLYDTSVYSEKDMERHSIGKFHDLEHLLAGQHDDIKSACSSFEGRWAGAVLSVAERKFLFLSYHGRKIAMHNGEAVPLSTSLKTAMSKEFIGHVANVACADGSPAIIAGCFNTNSEPLRAEPLSSPDEWNATVHVYPESEAVRRSSLDAKGQPRGRTDYAVIVHPEAGRCTDISVSENDVHLIPIAPEIAGRFSHQPLLISFKLTAN